MSTSAFFGKITINNDNNAYTINGNTGTFTNGDYYIYNPADSSTSLLDHVVSVMTTEQAETVSFTIAETGIVTFSIATGSIDVSSWLLDDFFGTTNPFSGASVTGSRPMRYTWFPQRLISDASTDTNAYGIKQSLFHQQVAIDKTITTSKYGELITQEYYFQAVPSARTYNLSVDSYYTFEEFWDDVCSQGRYFVSLPDLSNTSVSWEYAWDLNNSANWDITRTIAGSNTYFDIKMVLRGVE